MTKLKDRLKTTTARIILAIMMFVAVFGNLFGMYAMYTKDLPWGVFFHAICVLAGLNAGRYFYKEVWGK